MYEKFHEPPLSSSRFTHRVLHHIGMILPVIAVSLLAGTAGYHVIAGMNWVDSLYNASMIMSGMGPAGELTSPGAKIFASLYALYSGLFLIALTGLLLAPFFHRVLHKAHYDSQ